MFRMPNTQHGPIAPEFEELVLSTERGGVRFVYGSIRLKGTSKILAGVQAQVETGRDTNEFVTVLEYSHSGAKELTMPFFFAVPGGHRYRFSCANPSNSSGVTEAVLNYGFSEI